MTFLVDGNVLSEATKPAPSPKALAWLHRHERSLVIDPIILGEIHYGILRLPKGKRRQRLDHWFSEGIRRIVCLSWEPAIGLRWAQLLDGLHKMGRAMPIKDSLIAATALHHDLTVATRNTRDFVAAGVKVVNPFE